jgi:hypothetical protein
MTPVESLTQKSSLEKHPGTLIDLSNQTIETPQPVPGHTNFLAQLLPIQLGCGYVRSGQFGHRPSAEINRLPAAIPSASQVIVFVTVTYLPAHRADLLCDNLADATVSQTSSGF